MGYIDSEIILQRKISPIVYVYIMFIIVIILSLIIFFMLFRYKTYYTIKGIVTKEEENNNILLDVPLDYMIYITNNNIVIIDKKEYDYEIVYIDSEYFTDNLTTYQVIKINLDIEKKYQFNNLTLKLKFIKDDKKIIDYIIK